jgi:hypothetical protein
MVLVFAGELESHANIQKIQSQLLKPFHSIGGGWDLYYRRILKLL